MCKLPQLLLWSCLVVATNTAVACDSTYDQATGAATINCVEIPGDSRLLDVVLRAVGGNNFILIGTMDYSVQEPRVTALQVLTEPFPIAVISGTYPNACWAAYKRPTAVTQKGTIIDIRVNARAMNKPDSVCAANPVPFVQAVPISPAGDAAAQTYLVNGVWMTPTF